MTHQKIAYFLLPLLLITCFSCGSGGGQQNPTAHRTVLFQENFSSHGSWVLFADPDSSISSHDTATATISGGFLTLYTAQVTGCPTATAELTIPNPNLAPANKHLEIKLVIKNEFVGQPTDMPVQGSLEFHYGTVSETINLLPYDHIVSTQTKYYDYLIPATGSTSYDLKFEATACSADAFNHVDFTIDSITISYY